jgi:membrane protease YdiL (CAAX protease family)
MKIQSIFHKRPLRFMLIFATWWTLIFWTLPFVYLLIKGQEKFTSTNWLVMTCGIITIVAAVFIYVAMWIYLFARGRDPNNSRILWGIFFFFTGFYGSCVFSLAVYRKDVLAAPWAPQQPANQPRLA